MDPVARAEAKIKGYEEPEGEEQEGQEPEPTEPEDQKPAESGDQQQPPKEAEGDKKEGQQQEPSGEPTWEEKYKELEHKYKSFFGSYGPLKKKVEQLEEQNQLLMQRLEQMPAPGKPGEGNTLPSDASQAQLVEHLKTLSEDFGEEFLPAMRTLIKSEASDLFSELIKPVESQVSQSHQQSEQARRENFMASLTAAVPDWQEIWNSPEFDAWLDVNKDRFTGRTYADLLVEANNKWDLAVVAEFFKEFKKATGKEAQQQDSGKEDPRAGLVSPGDSNASSSTPPAKPQEKIWKIEEVNKFYRDVQMGKYADNPEELARIDQAILQANAEGRIR
jgi:hypothetical protein